MFQDRQIQFDDFHFLFFLKYLLYFRLQPPKEQPRTLAISLKDSVAAYVDPKPLSQFNGQRFGNTERHAEAQQHSIDKFFLFSRQIFYRWRGLLRHLGRRRLAGGSSQQNIFEVQSPRRQLLSQVVRNILRIIGEGNNKNILGFVTLYWS